MRSVKSGVVVVGIVILMILLVGGCIFDNKPPAAPILAGPPDKKILEDANAIELSWNKVDDRSGVEYEVQMDNDNTFATPEKEVSKYKDCTIVVTSFKDGIYYWKVRAIDGAGNVGPWSETRGFWLYNQPPYAHTSGAKVRLSNNFDATDPTWGRLLEFLKQDKTDENSYRKNMYESSDFAQSLHNNAEARGIKAAIVRATFTGSEPHYLNAFNTTDKGLIYVDCTNTGHRRVEDKVAYIAKGKPYGVMFMDHLEAGDKPLNDYTYYEESERKWEVILEEMERGDWRKDTTWGGILAVMNPQFSQIMYVAKRAGELQIPTYWLGSLGVVNDAEIYW